MSAELIFVLSVGRSGTRSIARQFGSEGNPYYNRNITIRDLRSLVEESSLSTYVEVNHLWRLHLPEIVEHFPAAPLWHLVRNGARCVGSWYLRGLFGNGHSKLEPTVLPVDNFVHLSRFEKVCWYWRYWNEHIEEYTSMRVRLEDLKLDEHIGKSSPDDFTTDQAKQFDEICGNLMFRYGYERGTDAIS